MALFLIWIGLGIIGSLIASGKGNSGCGGFALGVLLGPIGILIALFSSDNEKVKRQRSGDTKKCPYCAEYVKEDAVVCKHCGRDLTAGSKFNIDEFKQQ